MCLEKLLNDVVKMLFTVLCIVVVIQELSAASPAPAPPQNIHVDKWLLTWTPATEEGDVTYTVSYSSFDEGVWTNLPPCTQISTNSCNVISTKAQGKHGCVKLQVRAERHGLFSTPVKACSRHGDSCTPDFSLTAGPGSLTVHLNKNHSLALEHADNVIHRVYYGIEGEPLQSYEDAVASVTINELQEGQRYCTKVQYIYLREPVGLPSCSQCELIPESGKPSKWTGITAALVSIGVAVVILVPVIAYFLLFHQRRIKQWLQAPYKIPADYFLEPFPEHHLPISTSRPTEEHWDVISSISLEFRE